MLSQTRTSSGVKVYDLLLAGSIQYQLQTVSILRLNVKFLGSGNAAQKHRKAFEELPHLYMMDTNLSPDIVDICTPHHQHYGQICEAVEYAHVIVEKPICGSLAEMDELIALDNPPRRRICPRSTSIH